MKPGIKTTEFWLSLLAQILGVIIVFLSEGSMAATIIGGAITLLANLGYTVPRAAAKRAEILGNAQLGIAKEMSTKEAAENANPI